MSHCFDATYPVARKQHRCANCGEFILVGEKHPTWIYVDDAWSRNRMHTECLTSLQEDGDYGQFEFTLYGGERPR